MKKRTPVNEAGQTTEQEFSGYSTRELCEALDVQTDWGKLERLQAEVDRRELAETDNQLEALYVESYGAGHGGEPDCARDGVYF